MADPGQADCPREQKRNFDVKNNEENRHKIEPHVKAPARIAKRIKPAFIGRKFCRIGLLAGRKKGAEHKGQPNKSCYGAKDKDRKVLRKDRLHLLVSLTGRAGLSQPIQTPKAVSHRSTRWSSHIHKGSLTAPYWRE